MKIVRIKKLNVNRLVQENKLGEWLKQGFEVVEDKPKVDEPKAELNDKDSIMKELDKLGVEYDARLGVKKLKKLLEEQA